MIFVPLLHYFKCKNLYSGNEAGMRYLLTPTKRTVPDPEGGEGAEKEEAILAVDKTTLPKERKSHRECRFIGEFIGEFTRC